MDTRYSIGKIRQVKRSIFKAFIWLTDIFKMMISQ